MGRRGAPLGSPESAPLAEPPIAERPGGFFSGQAAGQAAGQVAQLVEHATENRGVGGSIPPLATEGLEDFEGEDLKGEDWRV